MNGPSGLEILLLGAIALLVVLWRRAGLRSSIARSRHAQSHWRDLVIPLVLLVLLVLFLVVVSGP